MMPADVTEQQSPEELLQQFRDRYNTLQGETQKLQQKIRDNESTALKLLGAIETLEYLHPPAEEPPTETPAETATE